jgi:diguanylate cyclase (GGDEF)-like protein/PAS domain S-box-containing protein
MPQDPECTEGAAINPTSRSHEDLRRRAEAAGAEPAADPAFGVEFDSLSPAARLRLLHELRVHQIELDMQNEELRQAQVALGASQARYFELYDLAPAGYCSVNPQGLIVEANLGIATLLGVSRGSLLNQPIDRFVFPEDADAFYRWRHALVATVQPQALELRLLPHAGMPRWVQVSATHWSDEAGAAALLYLVLTDIGERKQAEFALRDSEAFGRAIIDSVIAEIAVLDRQGTIIRVNEPWQRFALAHASQPGKPAPRTGVGMNYLAVCRASAPEDAVAGQVCQGIEAVLAGRLPHFTLEYACDTPQRRLWFTLHATPLGRDGEGAVVSHIDISDRKDLEAARAASEERLALILSGTRDGFWDWDLIRNAVYCSPRWWNMLGYADGELGEAPDLWQQLTHPEDLGRVLEVLGAALDGGVTAYELECRMRHKAGHYLHIVSRAMIVRDAQGKARRIAGANTDVSSRKQAEYALHEQKESFRLIAENLDGFVAVLDCEGRRVYNSPSYERLVGVRDLAGTLPFDDVHPEDRERVARAFRETVATGIGRQLEYRFLKADGSFCTLESRSGVILDDQGRCQRVVVVAHDISERLQAEERIRHLAFHDLLTQLPNRLTLLDRLHQQMAGSQRSGGHGALMFLDLDNFKPVNDRHGHEAGDLLLIEVATRLKACVRAMDSVARFGGDEFVVLLSDLPADEAEARIRTQRLADKIRCSLALPYALTLGSEGQAATTIEHHCTVSIGIALFIDHRLTADDILREADAAMYRAKEAGRNQIRFHDDRD